MPCTALERDSQTSQALPLGWAMPRTSLLLCLDAPAEKEKEWDKISLQEEELQVWLQPHAPARLNPSPTVLIPGFQAEPGCSQGFWGDG